MENSLKLMIWGYHYFRKHPYIYPVGKHGSFKIPWIGLTEEPDSKIKLAAGFGRHWPDARGVFVCEAWCNRDEQ